MYNWVIGLISRVFTNGPRDWGSIPNRVKPKTQKMVLDTTLLNTQHDKVRIKGKVEQSRERCSVLPYTSMCSYWKGSFWIIPDWGCQLYFLYMYIHTTYKGWYSIKINQLWSLFFFYYIFFFYFYWTLIHQKLHIYIYFVIGSYFFWC